MSTSDMTVSHTTQATTCFCPPALAGLLPEEIAKLIPFAPAFHSKQIFKWLADGAQTVDDMTNISLSLRNALSQTACVHSSKINTVLTDPDGTIKLQIKLHDGLMIETVLLVDTEGRKTACVSCQVGCAMGCTFCKTGTLGLARNLQATEIVEQFLHLEHHAGSLQNIVFMGMGEPLMNLAEIRKSLAVLSHPLGRNLSLRRVTLSTCGILPAIYDLADNGPAVRLAISLTTADEELRKKLMPMAYANPLEELSRAIAYYAEKTGKRCTLELVLLSGVNTSDESAKKLIEFAKSLPVHINIIPWNPVEELPYSEPSRAECNSFNNALKKAGFNVTVRMKRGRSIGGACGQLGKTQNTE